MSPENADYFGISEDAAKTGDYGFSFGSYESASDYSQYLISPELTSERGYVETLPATAKYIAIYYTSNFQYYLYVDDFTFQEPPTCMPVSGLTASAMQENSITIAWDGEAPQLPCELPPVGCTDLGESCCEQHERHPQWSDHWCHL